MNDFDVFRFLSVGRAERAAGGEEIVMVPVPRSRLGDVYAVLGRGTRGDRLRWEPLAWGVLRGSAWVARDVVRPAAREVRRQDLVEVGQTLVDVVGRSARALFDSDEEDVGSG